MPVVAGRKIENIGPETALSKGYWTAADYASHKAWVKADFEARHIKTLVFINGEYKGTATRKTKLSDIIDKFIP